MILEQGVHVHTAETFGIAGFVFKYLELVPVVSVEPIPGTKPHESLCVLNNRLNSNARQSLRAGQLSESDIAAFDDRNPDNIRTRCRFSLAARIAAQSSGHETHPHQPDKRASITPGATFNGSHGSHIHRRVLYPLPAEDTAGSVRDVLMRPSHPYTQGMLASTIHGGQSRDKEIEAIPGSPPDMRRLPPGCSFAPRCRYADADCRASVPMPSAAIPGRLTCCFKAGHLSPSELHSEIA